MSRKIRMLAMAFLWSSWLTAGELLFSGFASLRGAQYLDTEAGNPGIPGFLEDNDSHMSFKDASLFALQASYDFGKGLKATVQFLTEGKSDFEVDARWVYLSYDYKNHVFKVGRMANPIFYQSEYQNVGFIHNYAQLPQAVYFPVEFSMVEGVSVDSNFIIGEWDLRTKFLYGHFDGELYFTATGANHPSGLENLVSVNLELSNRWFKIYGGSFLSRTDFAAFDQEVVFPLVEEAINASNATQAEIAAFLEALASDNKDGNYSFFGVGWECSKWVFDAEYVTYGVKDSAIPWGDCYYGALGHRVGPLVFTLRFETFDRDREDKQFLDAVPDPILFGAGAAIHDAIGARRFDQSTFSVRWDFHESAAFKFDYFDGHDKRLTVGDYNGIIFGIDVMF